MAEPLKPSKQEIKNFLIGGVTVGAAFAGYKQVYSLKTILVFLVFGLVTLFIRELGQRCVARWMEAEVDLEVSQAGASATIAVAMFSYISVFNLAFLVPVTSKFSVESHRHWGKSIDAIWAKREYWLASSGVLALLTGWTLIYSIGLGSLAELVSLFAFFQLLPLDHKWVPSGKLDGVYIILWTGFTWTILMSFTIIAMILSVL